MKDLPAFALLGDSLKKKESYWYTKPQMEMLAYDGDAFFHCLEQIKICQQQGLYCVGYVSYEAGYLLNPFLKECLSQLKNDGYTRTPLLHFIAFAERTVTSIDEDAQCRWDSIFINLIAHEESYQEYKKKFADVQQHLRLGNSYQVNLTTRCRVDYHGDDFDLFQALTQKKKVEYAAFLPYYPRTVISLSPELFFSKKGNKITLKPMKGTSEKGRDELHNESLIEQLRDCPKNIAENLIIVDLMRNDLARICTTGSVKVDQPFVIESFGTVNQMSSIISGQCEDSLDFESLLRGLFPCGSITGAPKQRTQQIINQLETQRGIYTGIVGVIKPNNDMCFSVAIRTLVKEHEHYSIGVGGGVTVQSKVEEEWQELTTKLEFCRVVTKPEFQLVESLRYHDGFESFDLHLNRLKSSASHFLFKFNEGDIKQALLNYASKLPTALCHKVRLSLDFNGNYDISHQVLNSTTAPEDIAALFPEALDATSPDLLGETQNDGLISLYLCPETIHSKNTFLQHKTTHPSVRGFYDAMHSRFIGQQQNKELLFVNENKQVTEGRYTNLVVEVGGRLITPPVDAGLLPGIYRQKLLTAGRLQEHVVTVDLLEKADKCYLINDVRGMVAGQFAGWMTS